MVWTPAAKVSELHSELIVSTVHRTCAKPDQPQTSMERGGAHKSHLRRYWQLTVAGGEGQFPAEIRSMFHISSPIHTHTAGFPWTQWTLETRRRKYEAGGQCENITLLVATVKSIGHVTLFGAESSEEGRVAVSPAKLIKPWSASYSAPSTSVLGTENTCRARHLLCHYGPSPQMSITCIRNQN